MLATCPEKSESEGEGERETLKERSHICNGLKFDGQT